LLSQDGLVVNTPHSGHSKELDFSVIWLYNTYIIQNRGIS
jgi:hypothetical protein